MLTQGVSLPAFINILNNFLKCQPEQFEIVHDFYVTGIPCRYHTMGYFSA